MVDEYISVSIIPYGSGDPYAFVNVTLLTIAGEMTIRNFRMLLNAGKPVWLLYPEDIARMPQTTHRRLFQAIWEEFKRASPSVMELPVRPQWG